MKKTKKELDELFEKYAADACNKDEFDQLLDAVEESEDRAWLNRLLKKQWEVGEQVGVKKNYTRWYAAAVILLLVTTTWFLRESRDGSPAETYPQSANNAIAGVTRVKLPDGSTVVLRDGSWLNMTNSFEGTTREVSLEGEAYFDIASNPTKPFIIHTGRLTTTVLGTAFSIRAFPNDHYVTVTVTRGKVKVEDGQKLLGMLEADKQLVYDIESECSQEKTVDAGKEVAWRSHDLIFRTSSFETIVEELSRIYEVTIVFENETLKKRLITASLDDRDPIETILDILCTAQRTCYVVEGGVYVIKPLKNKPSKK